MWDYFVGVDGVPDLSGNNVSDRNCRGSNIVLRIVQNIIRRSPLDRHCNSLSQLKRPSSCWLTSRIQSSAFSTFSPAGFHSEGCHFACRRRKVTERDLDLRLETAWKTLLWFFFIVLCARSGSNVGFKLVQLLFSINVINFLFLSSSNVSTLLFFR